jgi:hypothetical protein
MIVAFLNNSLLNSKSKRSEPNLLASNKTTVVCRALVPITDFFVKNSFKYDSF